MDSLWSLTSQKHWRQRGLCARCAGKVSTETEISLTCWGGHVNLHLLFICYSFARSFPFSLFESTTRGGLRNTKFLCCISLARFWQFVRSFEETTFFIERKLLSFPVMISMCTPHQPQVASWKLYGSKVQKLNYHSFKNVFQMLSCMKRPKMNTVRGLFDYYKQII